MKLPITVVRTERPLDVVARMRGLGRPCACMPETGYQVAVRIEPFPTVATGIPMRTRTEAEHVLWAQSDRTRSRSYVRGVPGAFVAVAILGRRDEIRAELGADLRYGAILEGEGGE